MQEPGNRRFDVLQSSEDPGQFVLYEAYASADDAQAHKQTAHYQAWRDAVADWMAEPRRGVSCNGLFPCRMNLDAFSIARLPRIEFGAGVFARVPDIIARYGHSVMLVTGSRSFPSTPQWDELITTLEQRDVAWYHVSIDGEPSPQRVDSVVTEYAGNRHRRRAGRRRRQCARCCQGHRRPAARAAQCHGLPRGCRPGTAVCRSCRAADCSAHDCRYRQRGDQKCRAECAGQGGIQEIVSR